MRARSLTVLTIILGFVAGGSLAAQARGHKPAPKPSYRNVSNDDKCGHDHERWGRRDRRDDSQCCDDDQHDRRRYGWRRWYDHWSRLLHHQDARQDAADCSGSGDDTGGGNDTGGGDDGSGAGTVSGSVTGDHGGVSGWSVFLIPEGGSSPSATATTGSDGSFLFEAVPAGNYTVCEADPAPDQEVLPADGSSASASPCAVGAGFGFLLTLTSGGTATGLDFLNGSGGMAF
jgi:hypothetical protein